MHIVYLAVYLYVEVHFQGSRVARKFHETTTNKQKIKHYFNFLLCHREQENFTFTTVVFSDNVRTQKSKSDI